METVLFLVNFFIGIGVVYTILVIDGDKVKWQVTDISIIAILALIWPITLVLFLMYRFGKLK